MLTCFAFDYQVNLVGLKYGFDCLYQCLKRHINCTELPFCLVVWVGFRVLSSHTSVYCMELDL